jgi:hypothetical protein
MSEKQTTMNHRKPIPMDIYPQDIPIILHRFFTLAKNFNFPKNHRFYSASKYYHSLKNNKATIRKIPIEVQLILSDICNILMMSDQLCGTNKIKEISRVKAISTLSAEAQIGSYYKRLGYSVKWLSPISEDPPDLIISNPETKLHVDVEVKIKDESFKSKEIDEAIKAIFSSLSKTLESLKNRKITKHPAIVAVHADKDLNWPDWLQNDDIKKRLESRLIMEEYKCISGIIFSGGENINKLKKGAKAFGTKLIAFRSQVARYPLPIGFLPTFMGDL